jgi:P-type Mg2+ transporter
VNTHIAGSDLVPPKTDQNHPRTATGAKPGNIRVSDAVLDAARKEGEPLLRDLGPSLAGLSQAKADERARATGPNELAQESQQGWPGRVLKIVRNPLVILLIILSALSFLTGDARAGLVMALMVALSVGLRFLQEARADEAAEKLKAMIHVTATVVRDGSAREIPLRDLVPGDIIKLAAGDMIPGDVRLLSLKDLFVSQGSLTGESLPVEKFAAVVATTAISPPTSKTFVSWGPVLRAELQRPLSSRRVYALTWGVWPARSPGKGRRRASTRASTASPGS